MAGRAAFTRFGLAGRAFLAALPFFSAGCGPASAKRPDLGPPTVTVAVPLADTVETYAELTGFTDAPASVDVRPRVSGFIEKVNFKDGDTVKEGATLFEIDPRMFRAEFDQATAALAEANARRDLAKAEEARAKALLDKRATSVEDYQQKVAQLGVQAAGVQAAAASLEKAKLNLDWTKVTAPIAGRVDRAYLTAGNVVVGGSTQGSMLTNIVASDPIFVYLDVDDRSVLEFTAKVGAQAKERIRQATIKVAALGETGWPHEGHIDFVANRLDPATGSLQVRVVVPNPERKLPPRLFVRAKVPTAEPLKALLIPEAAVASIQARKLVYVLGAGDALEEREVTLGPKHRGLRAVLSGIAAGDKVVIRGVQRAKAKLVVKAEAGKVAYADGPSN